MFLLGHYFYFSSDENQDGINEDDANDILTINDRNC